MPRSKKITAPTQDFRTGQEWSRTINRNAKAKSNKQGRTVVKLKTTTTNYKDNPMGGRIAMTESKGGYKKVYKNGVLKKIKNY